MKTALGRRKPSSMIAFSILIMRHMTTNESKFLTIPSDMGNQLKWVTLKCQSFSIFDIGIYDMHNVASS
jgi:hypothetical protein